MITATLESSVISKSGQRLHLLQTTGSRIFLRVSGPLHPVAHRHRDRSSLSRDARPDRHRQGEGHLHGFQHRQHRPRRAANGLRVRTIREPVDRRRLPKIQLLLPGFSVKETVEVKGIVPEIRETAHVSVRPLYIAGSVAPPSGPFRGSVSFWAIPWILVAVIVVVILFVVGWIYRRRRRRRAGDAKAGPQKTGGQDGTGKQEARPDDVPVSNGSAGRQAAGHESPSKDPTPVASDERESGRSQMNIRRWLTRVALASAVTVAVFAVPSTAFASGVKVPFTDPRSGWFLDALQPTRAADHFR